MPVLTIIAGSNGCGKSTLTSSAQDQFQQTPILDPDAFAKSIQETLTTGNSNIEAGKLVLRRADDLIANRQSFTVETTLSGSTYLRMAARATEVGFKIMVVFVGTSSVEINIERVKARVEKGGHDVPEQDQRRRYPRTLANMSGFCRGPILQSSWTTPAQRAISLLPSGTEGTCTGASLFRHGQSISAAESSAR